jgi:hypothetical protein
MKRVAAPFSALTGTPQVHLYKRKLWPDYAQP